MLGQSDLRASAADVDQHGKLALQVELLRHRKADEARLLFGADGDQINTARAGEAVDKEFPVECLADGACRHRLGPAGASELDGVPEFFNAATAWSIVPSEMLPFVKTSCPSRTGSRRLSTMVIRCWLSTSAMASRRALEPTSIDAKTGIGLLCFSL